MYSKEGHFPPGVVYLMLFSLIFFNLIIAWLKLPLPYLHNPWVWPLAPLIPSILFLVLARAIYNLSPSQFGVKFSWGDMPFIYWLKIAIVLGLAFLVIVEVALNGLFLFGVDIFADLNFRYSTSEIFSLTFYPIGEEIIFRSILCTIFASFWGWRSAIIWNGILFAFYHFLYGNPSPENFLGGFLLAWIFYKSRSIVIPCLFHTAGNLFVAGLHGLVQLEPRIIHWMNFVD